MLETSLNPAALSLYLSRQIGHFYPDDFDIDQAALQKAIMKAFRWYAESCHSLKRKYFTDGRAVLYSHLHSDQHAMMLYMISRHLHLDGQDEIATRTYYLNKSLHAIDVHYTVELPAHFLFSHCVGTVLGKADYGDYFQVGQNCTVGNEAGVYPKIGEAVALYKGCIVVGDAQIGDNVHVAAHSFIQHQKIGGDSIAFGNSPDIQTKPAKRTVKEKFFSIE